MTEALAIPMKQTLATSEAPAETATALMAAKAEAETKARFTMAIARPRDEDMFRVKLMKACERPRFAETALYAKPVGRKKNEATGKWEDKLVTGLSVRFAEEALRYFGNLDIDMYTLVDDDEKLIMHGAIVDLETNSRVGEDMVVEKFVERRKPREGDEVIGKRENSNGDVVYKIRAHEDALFTKIQNRRAKLRRNLILQMIPADIKEEVTELCEKTIKRSDPNEMLDKLRDAFKRIGVNSEMLETYVGGPLEKMSASMITHLRGVFMEVDGNEKTWEQVVEEKRIAGTVA